MKKVLIITYYWPPSGGSGVQRWLKFVKYLPAFGWEPHVFTPENPAFAVRDASLERDVPSEAEVVRFPIWEPYDIFFKISGWLGGKKQATPTAFVPSKNKSVFQTFSTWVRGNFLIPDPRRFWVKPSVEFLTDYIARNQIETIITTGPPHSMHLIGLKLKAKMPQVRWLADFRDPWSEWGLLDSLMVSKVARSVHKKMERRVLKEADEVITITPFYVKRFEELGGRKVRLLTNGFDEDDFKALKHERTNRFIIRHVGIINEKCDPRPFMLALKEEMTGNPDFARDVQLEFIGEVHPDFQIYVNGIPALEKVTTFKGNIPHKELMALYGSASLLLLVLTGYKDAEGFLPGKLFEYLATGLPVLGVGPAGGDAAFLLEETNVGRMIESGESSRISKALATIHQHWRNHADLSFEPGAVDGYSRKKITAQLALLLPPQQEALT